MPQFKSKPEKGGKAEELVDKGLLKVDKEILENDLIEACNVKKSPNGIKLLNKGELKSNIKISVSKATQSSIELINSLGGSVNILEIPKTKRNRKTTKKKDTKTSSKDNVKEDSNRTEDSSADSEDVKKENEDLNNPEEIEES